MRELKFRAWDLEKSAWLILFSGLDTIAHDVRSAAGISSLELGRDDLVIQQYTGLKDKNSKEIFEGDIIAYQMKPKAIVEFHQGSFRAIRLVKLEGKDWLNDTHLHSYCKRHEIIGNIYENPELIK